MEEEIKVEKNCSHWQWTAGTGVGGSRLFDTEEEARADAERYFKLHEQIGDAEFVTGLVQVLREAGYDKEVITHIIEKSTYTTLTWA